MRVQSSNKCEWLEQKKSPKHTHTRTTTEKSANFATRMIRRIFIENQKQSWMTFDRLIASDDRLCIEHLQRITEKTCDELTRRRSIDFHRFITRSASDQPPTLSDPPTTLNLHRNQSRANSDENTFCVLLRFFWFCFRWIRNTFVMPHAKILLNYSPLAIASSFLYFLVSLVSEWIVRLRSILRFNFITF